jgi:hypothetical protein
MTRFVATSPETRLNDKLYAIGGHSVSTSANDAMIFDSYADAERLANELSRDPIGWSFWIVEEI